MEEINLHFNGYFNAIAMAHNSKGALMDKHIYYGNALGFDTRRITLRFTPMW